MVPDCHGGTQNASRSSSVSPAFVLVETPNKSICGGTTVSSKMSRRPGHLYRTISRNCVRIFKLHGMDYHRIPSEPNSSMLRCLVCCLTKHGGLTPYWETDFCMCGSINVAHISLNSSSFIVPGHLYLPPNSTAVPHLFWVQISLWWWVYIAVQYDCPMPCRSDTGWRNSLRTEMNSGRDFLVILSLKLFRLQSVWASLCQSLPIKGSQKHNL